MAMIEGLQRFKSRWCGYTRSARRIHNSELRFLERVRKVSEVDAYREKLLNGAIKRASAHSPFYKHLLQHRETNLENIPVTNKRDIVQSPYPHAIPPKPDEIRLQGKTSGSSGEPFVFEIDPSQPIKHSAQRAFIYRLAGVPARSPIVEIIPGKIKDIEPDLAYPSFKRHRIGYGGNSISQICDHIRVVKPTLLYGNRSHLIAIAEELSESHQTLPIPYLCSSSETVMNADKELLSKTFNCQFFEIYGSAEAANIAYYLPGQSHWEVLKGRVWVEILNEDNQPVQPGKVGRLVVTTLDDTVSPLIRYDSGDLATLSLESRHKSDAVTLSSLEGRESDSIINSKGKRTAFWSVAAASFWGQDELSPVKRWQIVQRQDRSLLVYLEGVAQAHRNKVEKLISKFLRDSVGDLTVSFSHSKCIHTPALGKFRAVMSLAGTPPHYPKKNVYLLDPT